MKPQFSPTTPPRARTPAARLGAGALLAWALLAAGCGPARRDALVARPVSLDKPQIASGERVFMTNCNECHPGGAAGLGPALNNKHLLTSSQLVRVQVRNGTGAMPRFTPEQIPKEQLDDLVAYLHALGKAKLLKA